MSNGPAIVQLGAGAKTEYGIPPADTDSRPSSARRTRTTCCFVVTAGVLWWSRGRRVTEVRSIGEAATAVKRDGVVIIYFVGESRENA